MIIVFISLLLLCSIYLLVFAIASLFQSSENTDIQPTEASEKLRSLFMIPVYKADAVILETVANIQSQKDFTANDEIVVVADSLRKSTIAYLKECECWVVEVKREPRSKSNAINTALRALELWGLSCDNLVLLDADNHISEDFISKTKAAYAQGKHIVQCHRVAKNRENAIAQWDAISEEINNSIFRNGHRVLGFSAALIGSGLSMDYRLFKRFMSKIEVFSGFDKQLELDILEQEYTIHYLEDVLVFDEKVRSTGVFETQRTRWIAAQINFAKNNALKAVAQLIKRGNYDFFDKYLQFVMPPRLLLLLLNLLMLPIALLGNPWAMVLSLISFNTLVLALLLAIPQYLMREINFKLLGKIPKLTVGFLLAICNINRAKGRFIHTPHHN